MSDRDDEVELIVEVRVTNTDAWGRVERALGVAVICRRCVATLATYADTCVDAANECEGSATVNRALDAADYWGALQ